MNVATLHREYLQLVGWHKNTNPAETMNPMGDMLVSDSGMWYNDVHPLLNIKTLREIYDTFGEHTYPNWSNASTYDKDTMVKSGSSYYISLQDTNLNHLVTDAAWWRETNPFNEDLRNDTLAGITEAIQYVLQLKNRQRTYAGLIKRSQVLALPGYKFEEIGDTENICGWRVCPNPKYTDVVLTIDRISIHMKDSAEETKLYLYKNGVEIDDVTFVGDGSSDVIWKQVNWELENGNTYYVAYKRDELGDAVPFNDIINMEKSWSFNRFPGIMDFAEVSAFEHDGGDGFKDITDEQTNTNNYGLNMVISASCDLTNFLVDHKQLMANVVQLGVGIKVLRKAAYNPNARINRAQSNIDTVRLLFEIDGDTLGRSGSLIKRYEEAAKLVTFDDRKLGDYCLPCKKSGLKSLST